MTAEVPADLALIEACVAGDRNAQRSLMQRLSPLLHAQISALLGRASAGRTRVRTSDAQDLLQDVLVELFRNRLQELRRWHPDRGLTLEGFVRLVARRFVVRRMRRLGRIDGRTDPADPDVLEAFETATHDGMRLESRDRLQVVLGALWGELGARDRELFERLFLAQEPPADVAAALGMSADALKKWRSRFYARATAIAERVDREAKNLVANCSLTAKGRMGMPEDEDLAGAITERAQRGWNETSDRLAAQGRRDLDDRTRDAAVDAALDRLAQEPAHAEAEPRSIAVPARWIFASLAAAAAVVMAWSLTRPSSPAETLPSYSEQRFEGGIARVRSAPVAEATPELEPGSRVRWILVPATATAQPPELRIHALGPETLCLRPRAGVRVADSGAIELEGSLGDVLGLPAGTWQVTALVATPATFAALEDPCHAEADGTTRPPGVQAVATRTLIVRDAG